MAPSCSNLVAAASLATAVALVGTLSVPLTLAGFSTLGEDLGLDQRDFRVLNNFSNPEANDNTTPHPNFPGHTGAVMAIWKAHVEWSSGPWAGDGLGDPTPGNPNLGDGGANFDNTFQGLAAGTDGINGNVHSQAPPGDPFCGGALVALVITPVSDGWSILYCPGAWQDGPGDEGGLDLQGMATHMIGHTLGLGHSTASGATMRASISGSGVGQRSINSDDIAGVQFVYGAKSASKPEITALAGSFAKGDTLTIHGSGFSTSNNQVWFTQPGGGGDPLMLLGVASSAGGTLIDVTIPASVGDGEVLVRKNAAGHASLSNAWPFDLGGTGEFVDLGPSGAGGAGGEPSLTGVGDLTPGGAGFVLQTTAVLPGAPGVAFVSLTQGAVPFKGGTFFPFPILLQFPVVADQGGTLTLPGVMDPAVPSGTSIVLQQWFIDAGAPAGAAGSNGLRLDVP